MATSALVMKDKYPGKKYHSDYGKLALDTRPHWKQVKDSQYRYKNEASINIEDGESILSIIKSVYATEVYVTYEPGSDVDRYLEIVDYGNQIIDKASR